MAPELEIGERGDYFFTISPEGIRLTTNSSLFGTVEKHIKEAAEALQVPVDEIRGKLSEGGTIIWPDPQATS